MMLLVGFIERQDKYDCKEHNAWINNYIPSVLWGIQSSVLYAETLGKHFIFASREIAEGAVLAQQGSVSW